MGGRDIDVYIDIDIDMQIGRCISGMLKPALVLVCVLQMH